MEPPRLSRNLYTFRAQAGGTSIFLDLEIRADGALVLEGQDIGKAPSEVFGDDDYEYWTIVAPEQKDKLLLALLGEKYGGDPLTNSKFRDWLTAQGIPFEGGSF